MVGMGSTECYQCEETRPRYLRIDLKSSDYKPNGKRASFRPTKSKNPLLPLCSRYKVTESKRTGTKATKDEEECIGQE
ncbi:hypothetical protein LshimejAT787_0602640 [Lyophyllum shimeji]|uniref:Uncharacterized protein n=1 Tax=Lyophyllum shimeji TaxID=47721 RepID=A0A9P3UN98_LYOSH|nr:hypothetical protein LshimejAT787_0602640 [Lyophyllum shimeji]